MLVRLSVGASVEPIAEALRGEDVSVVGDVVGQSGGDNFGAARVAGDATHSVSRR